MKILIAYRAIDNIAGGVERISIALMNDLVRRGHEIHFFTLDPENAKSFYPMDPKITWHKLSIGDPAQKASLGIKLKRFSAGRKLIKSIRPDVIAAFQDGAFLQMRAYSLGLDIPVVLAERIAPSHFRRREDGRNKALTFFLYRFADKITVQSENYISHYPKSLQKKITVIPNPVEPRQDLANPAGTPGEPKALLCVGRICHQKNQAALVEAFARLHENFSDWKLVLAGGEEDKKVRALVKKLQIEDKVIFLGAVKDVGAVYQKSHLFCLPSRWEGFPNALAEALSYGLPSIGYANCDGVNTLIRHLENGLLAAGNGNVQSLQTMLSAAMEDDGARAAMGIKAAQSVRAFAPRVIFNRWESFLKSAARS